ncbi:MAG: hypothetical protein HY814_14080 [Candidatus Riflebacteria bacterium]|nr:hypothetical protein [Candidatus Riflebacteria bacterium]
MGCGCEYLTNPDLAECNPRTIVPRGWEFRVHDPSAPLRDRWLSHFRIGSEERAGVGVLAPARFEAAGALGEALGQWVTLPPYESGPLLRLGLGLVSADQNPSECYGDFRVLLETESGHVHELFWGRTDNLLWRDVELPLGRYSGQTFRIVVENVSSSLLLVDYVRISPPAANRTQWRFGGLTVEVLESDPFLIEADAIFNEIGPDGDGSNRLLSLEADRWAPLLRGGAPYAYGQLVESREPRFLKARQALHAVTLTEHAAMRRAILHTALDNCLRTVRREGIRSLIVPPVLLATEDLADVEDFARDWVQLVVDWYRTYHPRAFVRLAIPTLYHPVEIHDLYVKVVSEVFARIASGQSPLDSEELIRLAGMANLVKTALALPVHPPEVLVHCEELVEALASLGGDARAVLDRVLLEAGLSEKQMLGVLTGNYRQAGRLDDQALLAYERLLELDPGNTDNVRAIASAYRCRFKVDGERTRAVYEQVFRADAADDENNRFLAAQLLLAGSREGSAMRQLVFERVGLGPSGSAPLHPAQASPERPLPPAEPFVPPDVAAGPVPAAGPSSEVYEPEVRPPAPESPFELAAKPAQEGLVSLEAAADSALPPPISVESLSTEPPGPAPVEAAPPMTDTEVLLERLAAEVQEARKRRERPVARGDA